MCFLSTSVHINDGSPSERQLKNCSIIFENSLCALFVHLFFQELPQIAWWSHQAQSSMLSLDMVYLIVWYLPMVHPDQGASLLYQEQLCFITYYNKSTGLSEGLLMWWSRVRSQAAEHLLFTNCGSPLVKKKNIYIYPCHSILLRFALLWWASS